MDTTTTRPPTGTALDPETLTLLRRLLAGPRGAHEIAQMMEISDTALARAAAGARVHRGTRALILIALDRLRQQGGLP